MYSTKLAVCIAAHSYDEAKMLLARTALYDLSLYRVKAGNEKVWFQNENKLKQYRWGKLKSVMEEGR